MSGGNEREARSEVRRWKGWSKSEETNFAGVWRGTGRESGVESLIDMAELFPCA